MGYSPALDMGAGVMIAMFGLVGLALWGIPAFLIEGWILKVSLSAKRPFRNSFIMNLVTTLIGFFAIGTLTNTVQEWAIKLIGLEGDPSSLIYYEVGLHTIVGFLIIMFMTWVLSILIEGFILSLLEASLPKNRVWQTIFWANVASYILPVIFIALWISQNRVSLP